MPPKRPSLRISITSLSRSGATSATSPAAQRTRAPRISNGRPVRLTPQMIGIGIQPDAHFKPNGASESINGEARATAGMDHGRISLESTDTWKWPLAYIAHDRPVSAGTWMRKVPSGLSSRFTTTAVGAMLGGTPFLFKSHPWTGAKLWGTLLSACRRFLPRKLARPSGHLAAQVPAMTTTSPFEADSARRAAGPTPVDGGGGNARKDWPSRPHAMDAPGRCAAAISISPASPSWRT
jgi:hypothetical protein